MAANEKTSPRIASIAARGLKDPASLSLEEIREICGSVLTQAPDNAMAVAFRYAQRHPANAMSIATILKGS